MTPREVVARALLDRWGPLLIDCAHFATAQARWQDVATKDADAARAAMLKALGDE
jgi:hypothetical protein